MSAMKVKKGDVVHILSGKDRGKQGRVLQADWKRRHVTIENLNLVKRHTRPKPIRESSRIGGGMQTTPGGVIEKPAPLPVSKVMVVCPTCGRPTRIGTTIKQVKGEQTKVRVCKRADCREEIDR